MTTQLQTDKYPWLTHIESFEIRGQIVTIAHDGPDEDEHPDVNAPIGRVIFEYASEFGFKYTNVEDGRPRSIFLMPETVVAPILSDGTIGSPDMKIEETDGAVRLMPTSVEGLEPSDTTIKATIQLDNFSSKWPPIYFKAQPGDRLNLADLIPEDYFPGVITVVDDSILRQTLYASNQAFDYQEEAKSHAEKAGQSLTTIQKSITNIDSKVLEAQQHATKAETHASEIVGKNTEASRILGESKTILIDTGKLLSSAQTASKSINEAKLFFDNIYQEHGMLKGDKGDRGPQGLNGVGIVKTTIEYAMSTSGTTPPTSGWVGDPPLAIQGRYIWTRTVWKYSDNSTKTSYSVSWIGRTGDAGPPGPPGPPITGVVPVHYWFEADGGSSNVVRVDHQRFSTSYTKSDGSIERVFKGDVIYDESENALYDRFMTLNVNLTGNYPKRGDGLYADTVEVNIHSNYLLETHYPLIGSVLSTGFTIVQNGQIDINNGRILLRIIQIANATASALRKIGITWIEDN